MAKRKTKAEWKADMSAALAEPGDSQWADCLYQIRKLVEPIPGKLMQDELVDAIRRIIAERDAARGALERAQGDINWMLNNRQFLNGGEFDYIEEALNGGTHD